MSITSSINNALSGLRATQAGIDVVSQNVANAGSVGYTRRTLNTEQAVAGGQTIGVDVKGSNRTLDTLVQRQLRLEQAGASYSSAKAAAHSALDGLFDAPGGTSALPTLLGNFTNALQALANNPSSYTTQSTTLAAASDLASSLNTLSGQVQSLRQDQESALGTSIAKANGLLQQIRTINGKIVSDPSSAALQDQRDGLIDQLSTLLDVKVTPSASGSVSISTTGGLQLFNGVDATKLSFDARSIGPGAVYDPDPAKRGVGTITATDSSGATRDVIATGGIRSGAIAAEIELRDKVLPKAQAQLDELAAGLASSLSDKNVAGTPASSGAQAGFDLDLSGLSAGNTFTVSLLGSGGATRTLTFVKATSASGAAAATGPGRTGIDFSGGPASIVSQVQAALGSSYTVSSPSGTTLRVLGAGGANTVASLSGSATVTGLASGSPEIPLFVDGGNAGAPYTGSYEAGSQLAGFASRISVNAGVKADPASLVKYASSTSSGDTARPLLILDRLTAKGRSFSGAAGIGGSDAPFSGSVVDFAQALITDQASDANAAATLNDGQQVVLNSIQSRFSDQAGVNIDTELTQLIQLQTAYGANARLLTAAKDMMDMLLRIGG